VCSGRSVGTVCHGPALWPQATGEGAAPVTVLPGPFIDNTATQHAGITVEQLGAQPVRALRLELSSQTLVRHIHAEHAVMLPPHCACVLCSRSRQLQQQSGHIQDTWRSSLSSSAAETWDERSCRSSSMLWLLVTLSPLQQALV
jgi:hypothetical protein